MFEDVNNVKDVGNYYPGSNTDMTSVTNKKSRGTL